jgi:hypothetical protein
MKSSMHVVRQDLRERPDAESSRRAEDDEPGYGRCWWPGPDTTDGRIFLHGQNMRIGIPIYASIVVPAAGHSTAQFPASCLIKKRLPRKYP